MKEKELTISFDMDAGCVYILVDGKKAYCYHTNETQRLAERFEKVMEKAIKQYQHLYRLQ